MRRAVTCLGAVVAYVALRLLEVKVVFKNSDKVHPVRKEVRTIVREAALVGLSALLSCVAADMALEYSRSGFKAVWTHMKGGIGGGASEARQERRANANGGGGGGGGGAGSGGGASASVPVALGNFPV